MSYIFSGLAIQKSAREMWDADASACRASENEYKVLRKRIAKEDSEINDMMTALENYSQNYDGLDEQFVKQSDAIRHAEDSVINEILGKTLQSNPEITPSEAKKVVEEAKRDFLK
jgi:predicted  nucleic acid-binding Zn-ribbon protein